MIEINNNVNLNCVSCLKVIKEILYHSNKLETYLENLNSFIFDGEDFQNEIKNEIDRIISNYKKEKETIKAENMNISHLTSRRDLLTNEQGSNEIPPTTSNTNKLQIKDNSFDEIFNDYSTNTEKIKCSSIINI